ncbi:MAG: zeta toxin family protein, partial [Sphingomicrobium sp.]
MRKAMGDPHRESPVAADMMRGWEDGKAGNLEALRKGVARAQETARSVLRDGQGVWNPVASYLQGYLAAAKGTIAEVRAKGDFGEVWSPERVLAEIEGPPTDPNEGADVRHPVTGETYPAALARARALLATFPGYPPGTVNIPDDAMQADGRTRGEMRADIVDALTEPPAAQGREAHILLGTPAAGKSSMADPLAEQRQARIIDSDDAKALLPEFENGIGAMVAHKESQNLAIEAQRRSIERGENMVLPLVGTSYDGIRSKVSDLVDDGFKVYLHLVELPTEETVRRAIARFGKRGRLIDPAYIREVDQAPKAVFERLIREDRTKLEGYTHAVNDVPEGTPPRLVAHSNSPVRLGESGARSDAGRAGVEEEGQAGRGSRATPEAVPERPAGYGANNRLVTPERAAELRDRLKAKLATAQLNTGLDPELIAIGTELAVFH